MTLTVFRDLPALHLERLPGPQRRGDAARTRETEPEFAFDVPVGPGRSAYLEILR